MVWKALLFRSLKLFPNFTLYGTPLVTGKAMEASYDVIAFTKSVLRILV